MKKLLVAYCLLIFGCDQRSNGREKSETQSKVDKVEKYVSMDSETGDITLTLNPNNSFDLTILFWDDKNNIHTGSESLKGSWHIENKSLVLNSTDNNTIVYLQTTTNMKIDKSEVNSLTYSFKSNTKPFFGTSHDLVEMEQTDKFILDQTKSSQK